MSATEDAMTIPRLDIQASSKPVLRAFFLALLAFVVGKAAAAEYEAGLIQVQLNPGHTISEVNAAYNTVVVDSLPPLYLLQVPTGQDDDALLVQMETELGDTFFCVEHSWRNETPEGTRQMVVAAVGGTITDYLDQRLAQRLHLAEAHTQATGSGVVVAVLDTGVMTDHEVFGGAILPGGYDFIDNDADPSDLANEVDDDADGLPDEGAGHGTLVAGIIHLVAPDAMILPVRVLDDEGRGSTFTVAKGIRYAVAQGADIINLSLGLTVHSGIIAHELAAARLAAVAMVSAAGNLGVDSVQFYPASDIKVLMVAALDSSDVKAPFSNYHAKVAVSAPGVGIYGPFYDGAYAIGAGTSFATPFVTGECALLWSLEPWLNCDQLYYRATQGVVNIYSIPENQPYIAKLGTGRFDGLQMLLTSPLLTGVMPVVQRGAEARVVPNPVSAGGRMTLAWSAASPPGPVCLFVHDASGRQVRRLSINGTDGFVFTALDDAGRPLPPGTYFVRVTGSRTRQSARMVVVR
jgi:subtilisin family serine protease